MTPPHKNLRVVLLLDGKPGHEKQSRGVVEALCDQIPVEKVELPLPSSSFSFLLWNTIKLLILPTGAVHPLVEGADFLIGTGSRTHLPLLLLKKTYHIPVLTCMLPAYHLRPYFDLCFVPEHDGVTEGGNIMLTLGPPNCAHDRGCHDSHKGLILLGGIDEKSHYWQSATIIQMIERIIDIDANRQWSISSSRRTPEETIGQLQSMALRHSNVQFFASRDTKAGWIEAQYDMSDVVWVTADSVSMIYEALSAGCKVGILPVPWKNAANKFAKNEQGLLREKVVVSFADWQKQPENWPPAGGLHEARRCAERIIARWQLKN